MKRLFETCWVSLACACIAILFAVILANAVAPAHDRSHVIKVKDLLP